MNDITIEGFSLGKSIGRRDLKDEIISLLDNKYYEDTNHENRFGLLEAIEIVKNVTI